MISSLFRNFIALLCTFFAFYMMKYYHIPWQNSRLYFLFLNRPHHILILPSYMESISAHNKRIDIPKYIYIKINIMVVMLPYIEKQSKKHKIINKYQKRLHKFRVISKGVLYIDAFKHIKRNEKIIPFLPH